MPDQMTNERTTFLRGEKRIFKQIFLSSKKKKRIFLLYFGTRIPKDSLHLAKIKANHQFKLETKSSPKIISTFSQRKHLFVLLIF